MPNVCIQETYQSWTFFLLIICWYKRQYFKNVYKNLQYYYWRLDKKYCMLTILSRLIIYESGNLFKEISNVKQYTFDNKKVSIILYCINFQKFVFSYIDELHLLFTMTNHTEFTIMNLLSTKLYTAIIWYCSVNLQSV